jgi:acetoin utilization deacetylase AcuC-like enzyme
MMRVVYSPRHALHNPEYEVLLGTPQPYPDSAARAEKIRRTLEQDGSFLMTGPTEHGTQPIEAVHDRGLIQFLESAWLERQAVLPASQMIPDTILHPAIREGMGPPPEPQGVEGRLGYWTFETCTPIVAGTYAAARAAVDVALTAADLVLDGDRAAYGLCRPPGHHAPRRAFGGYCYFNNAAVATEYLAQRTGEPVAVLDVDYHHGNGTQQIFFAREDILFVSLHADPHRAYPYFAGFADETGTGAGLGTTLNLPLPPRVTDADFLQHLDRALDRISRFGSGFLVVSLGFDTHAQDPLGDFDLSSEVYFEMGRRVAALGRRMLIVQEGGYYLSELGQNARDWLHGAEAGSHS